MARPRFALRLAEDADVPAITTIRNAASDDLTARFGKGHWSHQCTEGAVARSIYAASTVVACSGKKVVGVLTLGRKKPWAIDKSYFIDDPKPLYLTGMAVDPASQRSGVGRRMMEHAAEVARRLLAGSIRLDAYDAEAGAGGFYAKCGFREVGRVVYRKTPLVYFELLL